MSVADIRNYEAVNAGAQPVKKPQLKVVRADQLRSTSAAVRQPRLVCPDHPRTSGAPALYAVPTAPSASSAGAVGAVWRLQQGQCSVDQREEVVRSDLASNLVSGWQQLKEVIVSLHFKAVAGFLGLMASSVIAGVLVVGALGLFPSAGAVRVVQPGDTVMSIASSMQAPIETDQVVADIYALNAIEGERIIPGQEIVLPQY